MLHCRNYTSPYWAEGLVKPAFRCLVPVIEYAEWTQKVAGQKQAQKWFSIPSRPLVSFAGICRPTGDGVIFAFLTTGYLGDPRTHIGGQVNPDSIPVILHRDDEERWLTAPIEEALDLAAPYPSQLIAVR